MMKLFIPAMNTRNGLGVALVSGIIMAGAASASQSGVVGTVNVSPNCPGPQRLDEECASALGGVQVRLIDRSGKTVGVTQTSAKGAFEIAAPPGNYQIEVVIEGRLPRCPPTSVEITGGKKSAVRISCDSGIR